MSAVETKETSNWEEKKTDKIKIPDKTDQGKEIKIIMLREWERCLTTHTGKRT